MNKARRSQINKALGMIQEARVILEGAASEEWEAFENMSDGLQQSENGQNIEAAAEALDSAVNSLEEAEDQITEASA